MALTVGTRVGPYEVTGAMGAGGMGEVYRAHDSRLGRDVALKILPDTVPQDSDRLARFQREAQVLASLNHPNIAAIYGLEETGGTRALVMELVEGPTLANRIARGRLPVDEALPLARQIAEALEAAHEQGIVHRDLKPANVKIRPDGTVKVLDFGLAKALGPDRALVDIADAPTTTSPVTVTERGTILGTAAYMAPEQARGAPVDRRADIWAFGCVLYESLSGRRPFLGRTLPDVLVAVLSREPDWSLLPAAVPASIVQLVRRCLEKDPKRRLRDIGDARLELESVEQLREVRAGAGPERPQARWGLPVAVSVLTVVGLMAWPWLSVDPPPPDVVWQPFSIATTSSDEFDSRISPDGAWVSFVASAEGTTRVLVRRVDGGEVHEVARPAGRVLTQLWSPASDQLAYVLRQDGQVLLQVVQAFFGGMPSQGVAFEPAPTQVRLLRWIGRTVFAQVHDARGRSLWQVHLDRGAWTNISERWEVEGILRAFDVSPDGRRVVFAASANGQEDLWVANLDGTSARRLTSDGFFEHYPIWSGTAVVFQSNRGGQTDLWRLDVASGHLDRLTSSETEDAPESASLDGTLVSFRRISEDADLWFWDPVTGARAQLTDDALSDFSPTAATVGSRLVFQRSRRSPLQANPLADSTLLLGIVEKTTFRSEPTSLTDGYAARLSPDGSQLAYLQRGANGGRATLLVRDLQTGVTTTLSSMCPQPGYLPGPIEWVDQNLEWSPSGKELFFVDRPDRFVVRRYEVGAPAAEAPLMIAGVREIVHDLHLSADGALAYLVSSPQERASTLHILDVRSGEERVATPLAGNIVSRGWLPGDRGVVLARATQSNENRTASVEVLVASRAGTLRPAGVVEQAILATVRLDPARAVLYLARVAGGVHNLHEFSLASRRLRPITDNAQPGVTFSGIEPLDSGGFVVVRHERKSDVWLVNATASSPHIAGTSPQ